MLLLWGREVFDRWLQAKVLPQNTAFWDVTRALTTKCQYINNSCSVREGRDDQGVNKEKNCLSVSLKKCDEPLHPLRYARLHLQRWPGGSTRGWLRVVAYGRCRVVAQWGPHTRSMEDLNTFYSNTGPQISIGVEYVSIRACKQNFLSRFLSEPQSSQPCRSINGHDVR